MKTPNDGGPAFPSKILVNHHEVVDRPQMLIGADGMSLRDWMAGMALQSLAAPTMIEARNRRDDPDKTVKKMCHGCYSIADAMLAAREGKEYA